jgi:hypothetical protein
LEKKTERREVKKQGEDIPLADFNSDSVDSSESYILDSEIKCVDEFFYSTSPNGTVWILPKVFQNS